MRDIQITFIGTARNPSKRKRHAQTDTPDLQSVAILSAEWRQLLTECVKNGANARWETWLKIAGIARKTLLQELLNWLLRHGWVSVYEQKHSGDWWPYKLELLHMTALQGALGLPVAGDQQQMLQTLLTQLKDLQNPSLQPALESLHAMPVSRAIARAELLHKLHQWQVEERSGTYRDFSLFARDTTKSLTQAEWQWLDECCDLSACQIERHTPLLLLSAHLELQSELGTFNLGTCPDFAALTPATVKNIQSVHGEISTWFLVENRTSFERVARNRQSDEGMIWLPGYPPSWWKDAVKQIIKLVPAPAKISCDPDPAGIAIVLNVVEFWNAAGQEAEAWKMGVEELQNLTSKKLLTEFDQKQLLALLKRDLPVKLKHLAEYMLANNQKGEQEGYL